MTTDYTTLKPGTIMVTTTGGWLAIWIRLATFSRVNHAAVFEGVIEGIPTIIEATPGAGLVRSHADTYPDALWWRSQPIPDEQRASVARYSALLLGRKYGFLDIFALFLNNIGLGWIGWVKYQLKRTDRLICSQAVTLAETHAGVVLFPNKVAGAVSPGDIAELIFESENA